MPSSKIEPKFGEIWRWNGHDTLVMYIGHHHEKPLVGSWSDVLMFIHHSATTSDYMTFGLPDSGWERVE